jgi:hypothetical protein
MHRLGTDRAPASAAGAVNLKWCGSRIASRRGASNAIARIARIASMTQ